MKKQILILQGIQGSGKSTYAKKWVEESPNTRVRVNNDDIRNMLGPYWIPSREKLVQGIKNKIISEAMHKGYNIVLDNMNLNPREIQSIEELINNHNNNLKQIHNFDQKGDQSYAYEIIYKKFFTPVEECIRRDIGRPNPIGELVIRQTYEKYKNFYEECIE